MSHALQAFEREYPDYNVTHIEEIEAEVIVHEQTY